MKQVFIKCGLLVILLGLDSVYTATTGRKFNNLPQAERVEEEKGQEFMKIEGMERGKDGHLYFNGERVKSISTFGGEKVFEENKKSVSSSNSETPVEEFDEEELSEEDIEFGADYNDEYEEESKLSSLGLGPITKVDEIKKMTPIKSISEVLGMKEIKSIQEIEPSVAEEFIINENLENIIDDYGSNEKLTPVERIEQELEDIEMEIDNLERRREELELELDILTTGVSEEEVSEPDEPNDVIKMKDLKSVTPIKSIEEVKSITPVKSVKEIVNIYALTAAQANELKKMVG